MGSRVVLLVNICDLRLVSLRFSGGFDINVFQKVHGTGDVSTLPDVSVELVTNAVEDCKKPVVAAVEGLALGGGLEFAMGCHARIAAPRTQLGLPELSLGVVPGFGGIETPLYMFIKTCTRLVGLSKAIEMRLFLDRLSGFREVKFSEEKNV
ncbi:peroxisomal fatty acid beta-oxidation multifunctional protein AIM1-like [Hibiscus syriacus]|uniref:peroxisomal fatty acid beta-oxidation multifunctional protein AIM1-like n=1 Tax=Hibiscus syriacus TaxID=106335 RepID=UPI001920ED1E|nr:peroxisomal fatty acid beta-oxidation multifunctional protein AIM1-like [Hibiscus syriacus]